MPGLSIKDGECFSRLLVSESSKTGIPQGCVLSPSCSHCSPMTAQTLIQHADNTAIISCFTNNDKSWYREEIYHLADWCPENNLLLIVSNTKVLIGDFRRLLSTSVELRWSKWKVCKSEISAKSPKDTKRMQPHTYCHSIHCHTTRLQSSFFPGCETLQFIVCKRDLNSNITLHPRVVKWLINEDLTLLVKLLKCVVWSCF